VKVIFLKSFCEHLGGVFNQLNTPSKFSQKDLISIMFIIFLKLILMILNTKNVKIDANTPGLPCDAKTPGLSSSKDNAAFTMDQNKIFRDKTL
jgi:hypothetical protein